MISTSPISISTFHFEFDPYYLIMYVGLMMLLHQAPYVIKKYNMCLWVIMTHSMSTTTPYVCYTFLPHLITTILISRSYHSHYHRFNWKNITTHLSLKYGISLCNLFSIAIYLFLLLWILCLFLHYHIIMISK